jgi:hypothetical protein
VALAPLDYHGVRVSVPRSWRVAGTSEPCQDEISFWSEPGERVLVDTSTTASQCANSITTVPPGSRSAGQGLVLLVEVPNQRFTQRGLTAHHRHGLATLETTGTHDGERFGAAIVLGDHIGIAVRSPDRRLVDAILASIGASPPSAGPTVP